MRAALTPAFRQSVASRLPARRAVHGQRPVPAGHQQQGRPDRDLGARNVSDIAYINVQLTDGDRAASQDRHRRPGRKSLSRRPLPRHRRRHAAAHSAGKPVRDRRDDSCARRAGARDAAARGGAKTITAPGVLYTNNGTDNPPAVLGSLSALPSAVSYADGFLSSRPRCWQRPCLRKVRRTTAFAEGQALGAYTSFVELSDKTPISSARSGSPEASSTIWRARRTRNHSSMPSTAVHFQTCR